MKLVVPSYFQKFKCTASACKHSCCIGWEIDIDPESLERFDTVGGIIGKKLRESISREGDVAHFINDGERCPHLRPDGLCALICELGEDVLCDICREHPRYYTTLGETTYGGVGMTCEAAAELILTESGGHAYSVTENYSAEPEECDFEVADRVMSLCDRLVGIMLDSEHTLPERLTRLTREMLALSGELDGEDYFALLGFPRDGIRSCESGAGVTSCERERPIEMPIKDSSCACEKPIKDSSCTGGENVFGSSSGNSSASCETVGSIDNCCETVGSIENSCETVGSIKNCRERVGSIENCCERVTELLSSLEYMGEALPTLINSAKIRKVGECVAKIDGFDRFVTNITLYFLDRYMPEAAADGNLLGTLTLTLLSTVVLANLIAEAESTADAVELSRLWSSEIEYSTDNVDAVRYADAEAVSAVLAFI